MSSPHTRPHRHQASASSSSISTDICTAERSAAFSLKNTGEREEKAIEGNDEFKEVALAAPATVKDTLRCQVLDRQGKAITVQRGQNVDTTFADGGKGAWTFKLPVKSAVGKIVCDPAFAKAA
ncbi:hypothetical protein DM02DRAFT_655832 [Periconia macrospinosa]|uniref:Uncharacterized protein n=1 Tax=Periconia macrospinosa TaxID=97972 RepID=A0A2V1DQB8_9PLEO|nr:hypothetical protein DM02DRAFT_655832 [Periconia macrospinosa]